MKKFLFQTVLLLIAVTAFAATDFQLPDPHFEDWSGSAFNGQIQPKHWHGSNVEQSAIGLTFRFNFMYRDNGRTGYCAMTKGQEVGAAGITENAPGYFSLAEAWQYLKGLDTNSATAGSKGGIKFDHRPDSVAVWIKRTGNNTDKEDFHILYYAWQGDSKGKKFLNKAGSCTETPDYIVNEESDIRQVLDGNECGTAVLAKQVAEGWLHDRKLYNTWTRVVVPIYYMNDLVPTNCNMLFSASNYPNFRANDGIYVDNALYVDDVELIYSSKIQELWVGGKKWNAFDPNSTEVQVYSLGTDATSIPSIEAWRGVGTLSTKGEGYERKSKFTKTFNFPGRKLQGSEIAIAPGDLNGKETTITVTAEDNSSTTTYRILFQRAESDNAKLAGISYVLGNDTIALSDYSFGKNNYNVELPYGTTETPKVLYTLAEEKQTVSATQATSPTGKATLVVTSPSKKIKETYTVQFSIGLLKDNTLRSILVNGKPIPGFSPAQTVYKVSVSTDDMPTVEAVSAYPAGEQTITYKAPDVVDGGQYQISVSTPGNPTPKVYKLNFKKEASSYSHLADLQVIGDKIARVNPAKQGEPTVLSFDPENMTYYVNLMMGATELPQIIATKGEDTQTIEVLTLEPGVVDGTVKVKVTAGNGTDQSIYKIVFSAEKSEISTLSGITIGGVPLEGFDPEKTEYRYALPIGTTMETFPVVEPIAHDEFQTITISAPTSVNGRMRISVTAGNGSTTNYYITFEVLQYKDNTLKSLSVGPYYDLQDENYHPIAFDPQRNEYWVKLENDSLPTVTYEAQDAQYQTIDVYPTSSPNGKYKISVRPVNGASRTYTIKFVYELSGNTALQMIYINDTVKGTVTPLPGFHPELTDYTFTLDTGRVDMPDVTWDLSESGQVVTKKWDENNKRIVRLTVKAENDDKRTYKLKFLVPSAASTQLDSILLVEGNDTILLPGFRKDQYEYTYPLTGETCPKILAVKGVEEQQVTITAPYAAGTATILVEMEESNSLYTIDFTKAPPATVQLSDIRYNGKSVEGFEPTKMHYDVTLENNEQPTVEGIGENMHISVLWKGNTAYLHVEHEGLKAIYSVSFTRTLSGDNTLQAIYANGTLIDGFKPEELNYTYHLAAGSVYPEITYLASNEAQVLFFGQLTPGKWGITVLAENGEEATYTVQYMIAQYDDATLANLSIAPIAMTPAFDPNTFAYTATIEEGAQLPELIVESREGQTIMQNNANDTIQQVLVVAQSGAQNSYKIEYTRVKSNNVQLADILVNGVSMDGFRPEKTDYTIALSRDTKVVPNIFPVPVYENQKVTTWFSRPDGVTRIEVVAQDGSKGEYTIAFPVEKSEDTQLQSLVINGESKDVSTTEFHFNVPFTQIEPYDVTYKAKAGQLVHVIEAPLSGVTQIIVTNETRTNTRTYAIRYTVAQPQGENKVKSLDYSYVNASGETINGSLQPVQGENILNLPFGAKNFEVTKVEKNYAEQSVYFYNGGIRRGAKIIAVSNRADEADVTYTIVPQMPEMDTDGKLENLTFRGTTVPNFRPDVYNYIVKVTAQPASSDFVGTAFGGKTVTKSALDNKKKQITLTVSGGETYSVCWYYTEDENLFTFNWVQTEKAHFYRSSLTGSISDQGIKDPTGYKPQGWTVPADLFAGIIYEPVVSTFTYYTGKEVTRIGDKELILSTIRGGALNSSIPGAVTIGGLSLPSGVKIGGNTKVSFINNLSKYTTFRNTPEKFEFDYLPIMSYGISQWNAWISIGEDNTDSKKVAYTLSGNYNELGKWKTASQALSYNFTVKRLNILLCSSEFSGNSLSVYGGSESKSSDLQIRNIRFVYNSDLTGVTVNGKSTVKEGNTFTYTLAADEAIMGLPALKFTGAVHDQTQTIEWLNNGEWVNGELKARVVNYGENLADHTEYTVVLKRTPMTTLDYSADFGAYDVTEKGDSLFVSLPYGTKQLPDLTITPANIHQLVSMTKNGNAVSVNVKAENGDEITKVYVFREAKSDDAMPEMWALESGTLVTEDVDRLIYSVEANTMPLVEIVKKEGQLVDLNYAVDSAVFTITAEDGKTTQTFTIRRKDPQVTTSAQINEFTKGTTPWPALGGDIYETTEPRPTQAILFERKYEQDSVVHIQSAEGMEWQVYGSVNHTYQLIYPTEKSDNAFLAALLINGEPYAEFSPSYFNYTIESDSTVVLTTVGAEDNQQITTTQTLSEQGHLFSFVVTAEDEHTTNTYQVTVRPKLSANAMLAGIMLDSVMVANFEPDNYNYTVVVPSPTVKTKQPKMPNVSYLVGHPGQRVSLQTGELNGEETILTVTSEDGNANAYYYLTINAAPSHCSDLTGIIINGEALDYFEAGRHFYSVSLKTDDINIDYTSDDRFQKVETRVGVITAGHQYRDTLRVTAEDGTSSDYIIEIYVENQSNDAQLANILFDGKPMDKFDSDLSFDGGNNNYVIPLKGSKVLPEVSAQLKMDGQKVEIEHQHEEKTDIFLLHVTAVDGVTTNTYMLRFNQQKSDNSLLQEIELGSLPIEGFDPYTYFYSFTLKTGEAMPKISVTPQDENATYSITNNNGLVTILVMAEDYEDDKNHKTTYTLSFNVKLSSKATLDYILANRDTLKNYNPEVFYYSDTLTVGSKQFPDLHWPDDEEFPTVKLDTVEYDSIAKILVRQITVTAEDTTYVNQYTISYKINKSENDRLQGILVNGNELKHFDPNVLEYKYRTLTAAEAAALDGQYLSIEPILGDEWQKCKVDTLMDVSVDKTLDYKYAVTVTAESGNQSRTYTVQFPVELSSDATPIEIKYGNSRVPGWDPEKQNYRIEIGLGEEIPVISVTKREEAQTYEIMPEGDVVKVIVTAEDGTQMPYVLTFERVKSDIATLANIIITDKGKQLPYDMFFFESDIAEYTIVMPYDPARTSYDVPEIKCIPADTLQHVEMVENELSVVKKEVLILVVSPNEENETVYKLTFVFNRNNDASLTSVTVGEQTIEFAEMEYTETISLPFGTETKYTLEDITEIVTGDPLAKKEVALDEEGTITIRVIAQDETTDRTYTIYQELGKDTCNTLQMIYLDELELEGYMPDLDTVYVYKLKNGAGIPSITVMKTSENVAIETDSKELEDGTYAIMHKNQPGDTIQIECVSLSGEKRIYRIYFEVSGINYGRPHPSANDVFLRRVGKSQLFVAAINSDVTFMLYDQAGRQLLAEKVPVADPNDIEVAKSAFKDNEEDGGQGKDVLLDVIDFSCGKLIDIKPGQIYFYGFISTNGYFKSGKIIAMP